MTRRGPRAGEDLPHRRRLVQTYLRMVTHMDEGIGRILAALARDRRRGQYARGVHQRQRRGALLRHLAAGGQEDGPARGRHPRALHRPLARARARGRTTSQLAITMDWVATFLEAAGVAPHPTMRSTASASCRCWTTRAPHRRGTSTGA
jgi:arylsulfatase A-like enzyme